MKEPVINHKKNYALVSKYQRKYEKDFVKQFPECEIVYERVVPKALVEPYSSSWNFFALGCIPCSIKYSWN